jgi:hypothetical protein
MKTITPHPPIVNRKSNNRKLIWGYRATKAFHLPTWFAESLSVFLLLRYKVSGFRYQVSRHESINRTSPCREKGRFNESCQSSVGARSPRPVLPDTCHLIPIHGKSKSSQTPERKDEGGRMKAEKTSSLAKHRSAPGA